MTKPWCLTSILICMISCVLDFSATSSAETEKSNILPANAILKSTKNCKKYKHLHLYDPPDYTGFYNNILALFCTNLTEKYEFYQSRILSLIVGSTRFDRIDEQGVIRKTTWYLYDRASFFRQSFDHRNVSDVVRFSYSDGEKYKEILGSRIDIFIERENVITLDDIGTKFGTEDYIIDYKAFLYPGYPKYGVVPSLWGVGIHPAHPPIPNPTNDKGNKVYAYVNMDKRYCRKLYIVTRENGSVERFIVAAAQLENSKCSLH